MSQRIEARRKGPMFGRAPSLKRSWRGGGGRGAKPHLSGVWRGHALCPFSALLRFEDPRYVKSQVAEGVRYSLVPIPRCLDLGVIPQCQKQQGFPAHSDHYLQKGGVSWGCRVWLGGLSMGQWEKKGPKLRWVGESTLHTSAHQSGEVAKIEILARFNGK